MIILYPRLPNGNIRWSCDNCDNTAEVSYSPTAAVALYCKCTKSTHPACNEYIYADRLSNNITDVFSLQ